MIFSKLRKSLVKRPLCYALAGFLLAYFTLGFLRGDFKAVIPLAVLIVVCLLTFFLFFAKLNVKRYISTTQLFPVLLIILAICIGSLLSWINFDVRLKEINRNYHEKEVVAEATVININSMSDFYSSHDVMITEIDGESCRIKAKLTSSYYNTYRVGDTLRLPLKLSDDNKYSNLSEAYNLSHGFLLFAESESNQNTELLESDCIFPYTLIHPVQEDISLIIEKFTDGNGSSLSRALIYGDRNNLPYLFTSAFKELGISHMLAISGMHFSIVIGLLAFVLSKMRIPKRILIILLTLFVIFYAILAGLSASVCRAAFMLLFSYASFILGRRFDSVTSLFIAVFLICIINPYSIYDMGMLLSFLSTLGILTVAVPINEGLRQKKVAKIKPVFAIICALSITLSAVLFTLPITHFCFGYISYVSPLANLLFMPLITVILLLLPFLIIFSPIKYLAYAVGYIISLISDVTVNLSQALTDSGDYCINLDYPFCTVLIVLMFIVIAVMAVFLKIFDKHRELIFIPMIVFLMGCYVGNYFVMLPYQSGMSVIYYTEDENDAVILISDGEAILCDSSEGSYSFVKNAIEYVRDIAKTDITSYMITDYHYTHIGTVTKLVEYTNIKTFVLPISPGRDKNYHYAVTRYVRESGCEVSLYNPGENSIVFGDFLINTYIYEHDTANPAILMFLEDTDQIADSYMYISNTKDMSAVNEDFRNFIIECAKISDFIICGSHGECLQAIKDIEQYISCEPLEDSFYTNLK